MDEAGRRILRQIAPEQCQRFKTQDICTKRRSPICRVLSANLMSKTESKYDRRLRTRIDGWPTLDAQRAALVAAAAEKVFAEKVSGAVTDRKALARAIAALGPGDVLLVARAGQAC